MKSDTLYLITEASEREESTKGVLYAFNSHGLIEPDVLAKVINQVSIVGESASDLHGRKLGLEPQIGSTFKSEEGFEKFVLELCSELGAGQARILTRHEFNSLCEECLSASDFHQKIHSVGEIIASPEPHPRGGFFKKLFH